MSVRSAGLVIYRCAPRGTESASRSLPNEYLLLRANDPPHHWSPPMGTLNPGENNVEIVQTVLRKTEEQTGFKLNDYELKPYFRKELNFMVHGENKTVIYFLAKLKNPNQELIMSEKHCDFKWCNIAKTKNLLKHDKMVDFYQFVDVHLTLMNQPELYMAMCEDAFLLLEAAEGSSGNNKNCRRDSDVRKHH